MRSPSQAPALGLKAAQRRVNSGGGGQHFHSLPCLGHVADTRGSSTPGKLRLFLTLGPLRAVPTRSYTKAASPDPGPSKQRDPGGLCGAPAQAPRYPQRLVLTQQRGRPGRGASAAAGPGPRQAPAASPLGRGRGRHNQSDELRCHSAARAPSPS